MNFSIQSHLRPFAIATNITQASHCKLDHALLAFGALYYAFDNLRDEGDEPIKVAVMTSLEKRWAKCDQEPFILAVLLNPEIKSSLISARSTFGMANAVYMLCIRLWTRFFGSIPSHGLQQQLQDWFSFHGQFQDARIWVDTCKRDANGNASSFP